MFLDLSQKLTTDSIAIYARANGFTIGLTSGCYDLMHYYHLKYFERCKRNCDLIVANDLATLKAGNHEVLLVEPDASRQIVVNKYQQNGALEIVKRIHSLCESQQALRTRIVAKLSNGNTLDEIREKLGNENIVPYGTFD